jgi:uncharacterized protein (DUF58 family)
MSFVTRFLEPAVVERLNALSLSARSVVEGSTIGSHRSPLKGSSIEFRQHRFYTPGDEPRRLDWRVLARTDRPYIKEYDEETNLRCVIMLDCSGSMSYGGQRESKFDYACKLAAALSYLMLGQTESIGLATFGARMEHWLAPHGSTAQLARIIDALERATPRGESGLAPAMHDVCERLGRRALVIVISDVFTPIPKLREGLAHLLHDRHEVIVLRVLDSDELTFPFKNWSKFRGLEGEKPHLCESALVRQMYLDNFNRHKRDLDDACRALGAQLDTFVTDKPLIETVTSYLHRRAGVAVAARR